MRTRLIQLVQKCSQSEWREKILMIVTLLVLVCFSLLYGHRDEADDANSPGDVANEELSTVIPQGHLVIPITLKNRGALGRLIRRTGIIDVFSHGRGQAVIENLKVIKLSNDDESDFGALVPDALASKIQSILVQKDLTGALRGKAPGATKFHVQSAKGEWLNKVIVEDL